jgi:hypothetical protein
MDSQLRFRKPCHSHQLGAQTSMLLALIAFALPFMSGAHGALRTGKIQSGLRVGFWGGLISGLMSFIAGAAIGYFLAFVPGFPGAELPPPGHVYSVAEYQQLNVADALGGAIGFLFLICGAVAVISGTIGGCVGSLLARKGDRKALNSQTKYDDVGDALPPQIALSKTGWVPRLSGVRQRQPENFELRFSGEPKFVPNGAS